MTSSETLSGEALGGRLLSQIKSDESFRHFLPVYGEDLDMLVMQLGLQFPGPRTGTSYDAGQMSKAIEACRSIAENLSAAYAADPNQTEYTVKYGEKELKFTQLQAKKAAHVNKVVFNPEKK